MFLVCSKVFLEFIFFEFSSKVASALDFSPLVEVSAGFFVAVLQKEESARNQGVELVMKAYESRYGCGCPGFCDPAVFFFTRVDDV
jgi:hypothetical protein